MVDQALDTSIADLSEQSSSRFWGKYRGLVQSVKDDDRMGRITVLVPSVYGDEESPPALPAWPFAGDKHGFVFLPEKGDGVWIEFEGGDPSLPIWSGAWFAKKEMPDEAAEKKRVLISSAGLKVILDDDDTKLKLLNGDKGEITIAKDGITIRFGSTKIVLDDSGVAINGTAMTVKT